MTQDTQAPATDGKTIDRVRGLISLAELDAPHLNRLLERSCALHHDPRAHTAPLSGRAVGILFTKTSTRTRTAFTVGAIRLGGVPVTYGPDDLQTNTGELWQDTGRIFASMLDLLVARTAGPTEQMRLLSGGGALPIINAMSAEEHPTQGVCDLATMRLHFGALEGLRVLYIGEGNNTATALARGLALYRGCQVQFVTPPGYGVPESILQESVQRAAAHGASISQTHSLTELLDEVDVVYTTRWQTTGSSKPDPAWREIFRPYYVDQQFMDRWPRAIFMHDLPAHRGEEVASEVLESKRSIAWLQASMKLSSAMAVLEDSVS
jgi:ornithine carbamoyltransferase/carbamoyltransferase